MGLILKYLGGSFGPYIAGAVAALILGLMATASVQTARLHHAKADLATTRAALVDPFTKATWQAEANRDGAALLECRSNVTGLKAEIVAQGAAVEALKAASDAKLAEAAKATQAARAAAVTAKETSLTLMARQLMGSTPCERADDARHAFLEGIR